MKLNIKLGSFELACEGSIPDPKVRAYGGSFLTGTIFKILGGLVGSWIISLFH